MQLDGVASLGHYRDHLAPVLEALPADLRGRLGSRRGKGPFLVASYADARRVAPHPYVLVEHGAGQSYPGDERSAGHPCYSGGRGHERCVLFLCPSETVAQRWRDVYPSTPAVAVGAPKLDSYHRMAPIPRGWDTDGPTGRDPTSRPVVAVTFHWDLRLIPETRSAWPYFDEALPALASSHRWTLLGHGHPRIWGRLERRWRALGVERVPSLHDVFERADLLVGDNTSALVEFASLGKPVLWLTPPWYRREVNHGGRFWWWPFGQVQVDRPADLVSGVAEALEDDLMRVAFRSAMVGHIYAACDGRAAERAAAAIVEVLG